MNLIRMSFFGGILILVIVVVRALLMERLPKMTFYALWMAALVKLVLPVSFSSPVSVYTLVQKSPVVREFLEEGPGGRLLFGEQRTSEISGQEPGELLAEGTFGQEPGEREDATAGAVGISVQSSVGSVFSEIQQRTAAEESSGETDSSGEGLEKDFQGQAVWFPGSSLLRWIWAFGAVLCLAFFGITYGKCKREFRMSLPVDGEWIRRWKAEHRTWRKLEIRQSDRITAPLTYGILRPMILMPKTTDWDEQGTLLYVLEHEYVHIRRFDGAVKLLLAGTVCLHWFNPLVWVMYVLFNRDMELSCDEAVVRRFGERTRAAYAMTLIHMEEKKSGLMPLCNSFGKNAIEERIQAIMKIKKVTWKTGALAGVLTLGIVSTFATSAAALESDTQTVVQEETKSGEAREDSSVQAGTKSGKAPEESTAQSAIAIEYREAEETVEEDIVEENAELPSGESAEAKLVQDDVIETEENPETEELQKGVTRVEAVVNSAAELIYNISVGEHFPEYEKFGISYDKETGYLLYDNQKIGSFYDEIKPGTYTRFSIPGGEVAVRIARDENGKIKSLKIDEVDEMTGESVTVREEGGDCTTVEINEAVAEGNSGEDGGEISSFQEEYAGMGLELARKNNAWMYKGRGVAVLYDEKEGIWTNDSFPAEKAVYLEVVRNENQDISELKELSKEEMQKLLEN